MTQEKLNITMDSELVKELKDTRDKIGIPVSVQIERRLKKEKRGSTKKWIICLLAIPALIRSAITKIKRIETNNAEQN